MGGRRLVASRESRRFRERWIAFCYCFAIAVAAAGCLDCGDPERSVRDVARPGDSGIRRTAVSVNATSPLR